MRCPKCAYISFDHLSSCSNCGREFTGSDKLLQGTGISVKAPFFLTATVGSMVDHVGATESEGGDISMPLSGSEVDFRLEPDRELSDDGGSEDVDLVTEEEGAGGGVSELEADIDIDLGVETGAAEEVALEAVAEPEGGGATAASGEQISLVLADESEPEDIDLAGEEPPVISEDRAPGPARSGEDEVLLDFAGLDDLDLGRDSGSPDEDQPDLAFADEQGFEDLFTDLDLFEDSGDDSVADSSAPPVGEKTGLTLALDDEGEKPDADPEPAPKPAAPDSGLTLEIDDE